MKNSLLGVLMKFLGATVLSLGVMVSGCAATSNSFYGPIRPVQAGKLGGLKDCSKTNNSYNYSERSPVLEQSFAQKACDSLLDPDNAAKARAFYESGFLLVEARCNDFFAQKAGTQLGVNTAFDSVAPVVALLTGILSIVDFNDDSKRTDYESALAFGSVALVSGLKVYEENFLFATDNIATVRQLTIDTLSQHGGAVRAFKKDSHTFYTSAKYVIQNQMICTPGEIRDNVKKAVQNEKFVYTVRDVQALAGGGVVLREKPSEGEPAGSTLDQQSN